MHDTTDQIHLTDISRNQDTSALIAADSVIAPIENTNHSSNHSLEIFPHSVYRRRATPPAPLSPQLYNNNNRLHSHHHHHHHHSTQLQNDVYNDYRLTSGRDCWLSSQESTIQGLNQTDHVINTRNNNKNNINERSTYFDMSPATHSYCYRLSAASHLVKREPTEPWQYPDRMYVESTTFYSNLKRQTLSNDGYAHQQHPLIQQGQLSCAEPSFNFLNLNTSASPSIQNMTNIEDASINSYQSNYNLASIEPSTSSIVDSEYVNNSPTTTSTNHHSLSNILSGTTSTTSHQRRGSLQLWQFLVALLDEPASSAGCITWTGKGMEFKLVEPEEVARLWGLQKNRPAMNYDKLSRSLRYYYEKGIMQKVAGERYVYKFVCDPDALFNMAYGNNCADQQNLTSSCRGSSINTFNVSNNLNDSNLSQGFYN